MLTSDVAPRYLSYPPPPPWTAKSCPCSDSAVIESLSHWVTQYQSLYILRKNKNGTIILESDRVLAGAGGIFKM